MNRNKSVEASESIIPFLVSSRRLYRTFRYITTEVLQLNRWNRPHVMVFLLGSLWR